MLIAKAVDSLAARSLVRSLNDDSVSLANALVREVIIRHAGPIRIRQIHLQVANALAALGEAPQKIVAHLVSAGDSGRAYAHALTAAESSERLFAFTDAAYYLKLAYENAPNVVDKLSVGKRCVRTLIHLRQVAEATDLLGDMVVACGDAGSSLEIEALRLRLECYGRSDDSARLLQRTRQLLASPNAFENGNVTAECIDVLGLLAYECGNLAAAEEAIGLLDDLQRHSGDRHANNRAAAVRALLLGLFVDIDEAIHCAATAVENSRIIGNAEVGIAAMIALGDVYVYAGRLAGASECYAMADECARSVGAIAFLPRLYHNRAIVALEAGVLDDALQLLGRASEASGDAAMATGFSALALANIHWERGNGDLARTAALEVLDARTEIPWWSRVVAHAFCGLVELEHGHLATASSHRTAILEQLEEVDFVFGDLSYPEILIARVATVEGRRSEAVARLARVIDAYGNREECCRIRLMVERARLLVPVDPAAALGVALEARRRAEVAGAGLSRERADAIVRRIASAMA